MLAKERRATKMTISNFAKMLVLAVEFAELYNDHSNGLVAVYSGTDKMPELHLEEAIFYDLATTLVDEISFKHDDKTRPCFYYTGVRVFCCLTNEQAAARGYLTEAEAAFYGK